MFVEVGEECDCGLADQCDNPCCDPSTCKFRVNATCATGQCCDLTVNPNSSIHIRIYEKKKKLLNKENYSLKKL